MNSALSLLLPPLPATNASASPSSASMANGLARSTSDRSGIDVQLWSAIAAQYGLPTGLLEALTTVESGNNPNVVSPVGAIGYAQLMPQTAAALGVDPTQPVQNLEGGAAYLAHQLQTFHGNLADALAAYNAGPGAVEQYGGVPPYAQTQHYVHDVLALYDQYQQSS